MAVDEQGSITDADVPDWSDPGVVAVNLEESQSDDSVSDISGVERPNVPAVDSDGTERVLHVGQISPPKTPRPNVPP